MDSKAPVIIIVAIIAMGVILWAVSAVRTAGGIDPERAKTLAEEAERECVLEGYGTDECKRLVGENHRDCLQKAKPESEGPSLDQEPYIDCMLDAFAASSDEDAGKTRDTSAAGAGKDGTSQSESDAGRADAADGDSEDAP